MATLMATLSSDLEWELSQSDPDFVNTIWDEWNAPVEEVVQQLAIQTIRRDKRTGPFSPLFLRFSIGKCRNCPFFRAF